MDIIVRLILLAGVCFPSSCLLHRLLLVKEAETWENAQKYCREKCVDLVSPDDMEDMKAVLRVFQGGDVESVWMGLKMKETWKWHWSLTGKNYYKQGERNYIALDTDKVGQDCVAFKDGSMNTRPCNTELYGICFDETQPKFGTYPLALKHMEWKDSQSFCRALYTDLASVRNREENRILKQVTEGKEVWIGRFRDTWSWSDGSESSFRYWRKAEVFYETANSPLCAASLTKESGKWTKVSCEEKRPFLCNCVPTFRYAFKVKIRSEDAGLDVNDPSVQAQILEHIKQQLINAGQTETSQIQWRKNPDENGVFIREPNTTARNISEKTTTCVELK